MRINRLDLTRYGKFTDRSIDFGARPTGTPDLHILYGPNEAGKSTALSAWLDLLFGIPTKSGYNFLHPYNTMRVGAHLDLDGASLDVARTKGRQNTLLDGTGAVQSDAVLQQALGGIDRAAYEAMFSLDDDTIEKGGESILASQGDLGQLLFSASAGLAELGTTLDGLRDRADTFYRAGKRSGGLTDLKTRLTELEEQRRAIDTQASDYARLSATEEQAHAAWTEAQTAHAAVSGQLETQRRVLAALPVFGRLTRTIADLAPLASLPVPPPDWAGLLPDLTEKAATAQARQADVKAEIARLTAQRDALTPDPAALAIRPRVTAAEALKSAHDEAQKDLPNRQAEAAEMAQQITGLTARLGRSGKEPASLILDAATTGGLRGLIEAKSGIDTRLATAVLEATEARRDLDEAKSKLETAGGGAADTGALALLVAGLRQQDPGQALRAADRQLRVAKDAATLKLAALRPWAGKDEALLTMTVPTRDKLDAWGLGLEQARQSLHDAAATLSRLRPAAAKTEATLATRQTAGRINGQDLAEQRALRERHWAAHRKSLDAASADLFEATMRLDDQMAAQNAALGAEETRIATSTGDLATLRVDIAAAELAHDRATTDHDRIKDTIAQAIARMAEDLPRDMSPADLRDWLVVRAQAVDALGDRTAAQSDCDSAMADLSAARATLIAGLTLAGAKPDDAAPFDVLLAQARTLTEADARLAALREALGDHQRRAARRTEDLDLAQAADRDWHDAWGALCKTTWLGQTTPPDVAMMGEILTASAALDRALAQQSTLHDRIAKMEQNVATFAQTVAGLGADLDLPPTAPSVLWMQINDRIKTAAQAQRDIEATTLGLQQAQAKDAALTQEIVKIDAQISEMAQYFGSSDLAGLRVCLADAGRRDSLRAAQADLSEDLRQAVGRDDLTDAMALLAKIDRDGLDLDIARLATETDQLNQQMQTLFAEYKEASRQTRAVGGDDAVARLAEARETVLLDIAEETRRHLGTRFGIIAVGHALRAYRDSHRSAMMQRASKAFRTLTRGEYRGLDAQPDKDRELLVAIGADGGSKLAQDMSKGTRFQLYLALRVAGYHEFARTRPPVPFVADDIMETFDDDRSAEAFMLLSGMAEVGQVIYLTHHRHLCDIAKSVCPTVRIHQLAD